jgi:hypothetical protein
MDNLSASALSTLSGIANDDLVIMYDQTESGNIKLKKIEYSNFITGLATETYVDTAVSGVDADKLDGHEASEFALKANDAYFGKNIIVPNTYGYYVKLNDDTTNRKVLTIDASNIVNVGHASHTLALKGAGDLSFNGNKMWHAGNDGSGSGLDADKLDGYEALDMQIGPLTGAGAKTAITAAGDWDSYMEGGFYKGQSLTNESPYKYHSWQYTIVIRHNDDYVVQLAKGYNTTDGWSYRTLHNSEWGDWAKLLDSTDEGSGNGIDADTVDGLEASQFLRKDTDTTFISNRDLVIGSGEGALKMRHAPTDNRFWMAPYAGGEWAYTREITFDADEGEWNIEGSPRAGGYRILTVADEGSGNGIDADTVDGIEGNQFLRNDQSGSITGSLTVSSGTMNIPNGSIISKQLDVSSSQINLDVSNCNSLDVNTSSGDVTISGLTGGVAGHILTLTKATLANNFIIEHNEGDGDQNIFTRDTTDITLSGYGGIILVCNGSDWFECGR